MAHSVPGGRLRAAMAEPLCCKDHTQVQARTGGWDVEVGYEPGIAGAGAGAPASTGVESVVTPLCKQGPGLGYGQGCGSPGARPTPAEAEATPPCRPGPGLGYGLGCGTPSGRPMSAEAANAVTPPASHPVPMREADASAPSSPLRDMLVTKNPANPTAGCGTPCGGGGAAMQLLEHSAGGGSGDSAHCEGPHVVGLGLGSAVAHPPARCASPSSAASAAATHRACALARLAAGARHYPRPHLKPTSAGRVAATPGATAVPAPDPAPRGSPQEAFRDRPELHQQALNQTQVAPEQARAVPAAAAAAPALRAAVPATAAGGAPRNAAVRAAARSQRATSAVGAAPANPAFTSSPGPLLATAVASRRGDRAPGHPPQGRPDPSPSPSPTLDAPPMSAMKRGLSRLLGLSPLRLGRGVGKVVEKPGEGIGNPGGPQTTGDGPVAQAGPLAAGRAGWPVEIRRTAKDAEHDQAQHPGSSTGSEGSRWQRRNKKKAGLLH